MVNPLLTISIKVNVPSICRVGFEQGTNDEKANSRFLGLAAWRLLEVTPTHTKPIKGPDFRALFFCDYSRLAIGREIGRQPAPGFGVPGPEQFALSNATAFVRETDPPRIGANRRPRPTVRSAADARIRGC